MDIQNAYELIMEKLSMWVNSLISLLPNIFLAAVVLTIGLFLSKKLKNLASRLIRRVLLHATLVDLFSSMIYLFFIGVTIFITLSILKLDKAVTSILAGAGIIGLALAFAFQDIAANFISGVFISFRRPLGIGDIVKIGDYMGKVEAVNLRDTVIRTFQGQMVIIPNKNVFQNPIENYSLLGKRRFDLVIGVSYGEDLRKVMDVTLNAVKDIKGLSKTDETSMYYQEFGDSSINFVIRLWVNCPEQPDFLEVGSEAIMRIKRAYDANDITIPFPIRTLDFGIKGGQTLSEMSLNLMDRSSSGQ